MSCETHKRIQWLEEAAGSKKTAAQLNRLCGHCLVNDFPACTGYYENEVASSTGHKLTIQAFGSDPPNVVWCSRRTGRQHTQAVEVVHPSPQAAISPRMFPSRCSLLFGSLPSQRVLEKSPKRRLSATFFLYNYIHHPPKGAFR